MFPGMTITFTWSPYWPAKDKAFVNALWWDACSIAEGA